MRCGVGEVSVRRLQATAARRRRNAASCTYAHTSRENGEIYCFAPFPRMLCAAVNFNFILILINFDFILYYNLLLCFIQQEMHVRLISAIKFYLLTYLIMSSLFTF